MKILIAIALLGSTPLCSGRDAFDLYAEGSYGQSNTVVVQYPPGQKAGFDARIT